MINKPEKEKRKPKMISIFKTWKKKKTRKFSHFANKFQKILTVHVNEERKVQRRLHQESKNYYIQLLKSKQVVIYLLIGLIFKIGSDLSLFSLSNGKSRERYQSTLEINQIKGQQNISQ